MTKDTRTRIIIAVIGVAVIVVGTALYRKQREKSSHAIECTITAVDVGARTASIEFVHPKSGKRFTLAGGVPEDCDIRIDGKPATLADVRVGEVARVEGKFGSDRRVTAKSVWITRAPATSSAPAVTTRPAGAA